MRGDSRSAMKENIVIPIHPERVKRWGLWALEATSWLVCLGMLAAGAVIAVFAVLVWCVSGTDGYLLCGMSVSLLLGLVGVRHLLRQLDRTVRRLRRVTPELG